VGAPAPRIGPVDELLDEWLAVRHPVDFGTPAARRASKTVWMTTNGKPYRLRDSTPATPRFALQSVWCAGNSRSDLSHRTAGSASEDAAVDTFSIKKDSQSAAPKMRRW
jgi:hypothetical protein